MSSAPNTNIELLMRCAPAQLPGYSEQELVDLADALTDRLERSEQLSALLRTARDLVYGERRTRASGE